MAKLLNIQPDTAVLIYQFIVQMIRFGALVINLPVSYQDNLCPC